MRYFFQSCLLMLLLLATAIPSFATSASTAEIRIVPIGADKEGVVLCKTFLSLNRSGAGSGQHVEYGWLAVSAAGIWEEATHAVIDNAYDVAQEHIFDGYRNEFEGGFDWKMPPPSVRQLLGKYSFQALGTAGNSNESITWSPDRICRSKQCVSRSVRQRSIGNLQSTANTGSTLRSYFYYKGVALFHNRTDPDDDHVVGADMHIENMFEGEDIGIDIWEIDGLALIPAAAFK